jgi:hypothetical protein
MPTLTDTELDLMLRGHCPGASPSAAAACVDDPEFDLGRLLALRAGADDAAALDHVSRCAFCRALLVEAAEPATDLLVARMDRAWSTVGRPEAGADAPAAADPAPARRPARVLRFGALGGAIALAAGVLFFALRPGALPPAPEYTLDGPTGGLTEVRADVPASNVYLPESQVRLVLRPAGPVVPGAAAALFRVEADARLVALPAGLVEAMPNGAFLIEAAGRTLFGDTPGRKRLALVVAREGGRLAPLDGASVEALDGRPELRLFEVDVEYRLTP